MAYEPTVQDLADAARRARQPKNPAWANPAPQWIQGTHGGHLLDNYVPMDAAGQMAATFGVNAPAQNSNTLGTLAKGGGVLTTLPSAPYTGPAATRTAPTDAGAGGVSAGQYVPASGGVAPSGGGVAPTGNVTWGNGNTGIVPPVAGGNVDPGSDAGGVGYGFNVNDYLDPSMAFQMSQGLNALQNSAAARGNLNSGQTLKDILAYSQGLAGQDFNNAFNRAANVRDFTYGVDTGDRAFAYNAMNNDRNFNYNTLRDLAGMGLSGAGQASNADTSLSGLIAALISNQGQIQGTGGIGGSNSINNTISAILNQLMQSRLVGNVFGG